MSARTPSAPSMSIHAALASVVAFGLVVAAAQDVRAQDRDIENGSVVLLGKVVDAQSGEPLHGAFVSQDG